MRVKTGVTRRRHHKKVLQRTKGMRMTKGRLYKVSREADLHQGQYQYIGRRLRKRDLRRLWIQRINAALAPATSQLKYSRFIKLLNLANIKLNRKILSHLAATDIHAFQAVITQAQKEQKEKTSEVTSGAN